jgi:predicted Zn-dependent protease
MKRRDWLVAGCARCAALATGLAGLAGSTARAATTRDAELPDDWKPPARFAKPDLASDEGGLWALMEREETRMRRSPFLMRDVELRDYLQGIACKLAGEHCPDVRTYPMRVPYFNASMAPNGMMQVWSGLLLRVDNEAQLAAVMGHETGHYLRRHALDQLHDVQARSAFATFMAMFGAIGLVGQMAAIAGGFGFSRDQERQADRIGLTLMRNAGYDPRQAAAVWENLLAELASSSHEDPAKRNPLFATHPPSEERSATLKRLSEDAGGGFVGEAEYAARIRPMRYGLLEDELKRGQPAETLNLLDRMIKREADQAELWYFRGETRRLRGVDGDNDAALADLNRAVALGGEPPQVYRALGFVQQKLQHGEDARAAFTRYLERAPDAPDAALIRQYLTEPKA